MIKLSIIIPVYNAKNNIWQLIDDLLNQSTRFEYEIIIVDDYSSDWTIEVLKKLKSSCIKIYYNKKNRGNWYTKNYWVKKSVWELLIFLDDHCRIGDRKFITKYCNAYNDLTISWVCWHYQTDHPNIDYNYYRDLRRLYIYKKKLWSNFLLQSNNRSPFSIVIWGFRRIVFNSYSFPATYGQLSCEDTIFQLELENNGHKLLYDWTIFGKHTHDLWIWDILRKIKIEAKGSVQLTRSLIQKKIYFYPYLKLYLDSVFLPYLTILPVLLVNLELGLVLFCIFYIIRYFNLQIIRDIWMGLD